MPRAQFPHWQPRPLNLLLLLHLSPLDRNLYRETLPVQPRPKEWSVDEEQSEEQREAPRRDWRLEERRLAGGHTKVLIQ